MATGKRAKCPDCGRSYATVGIMNRHRKNHTRSVDYTCDVCGAVFRRKDVLDRHMRGHGEEESDRDGGSEEEPRTTCIPCARAKVKCNRRKPCSGCAHSGCSCVYKEDDGHQATGSRKRRYSASNIALGEDGILTDGSLQNSTSPSARPVSTMLQPSDLGNMPQLYSEDLDIPLSFGDDLWFRNASWPWLHEAMYLQQNGGWENSNSSNVQGHASTIPMDVAVDFNPTNDMFGLISLSDNTSVSSTSKGLVSSPWPNQPTQQCAAFSGCFPSSHPPVTNVPNDTLYPARQLPILDPSAQSTSIAGAQNAQATDPTWNSKNTPPLSLQAARTESREAFIRNLVHTTFQLCSSSRSGSMRVKAWQDAAAEAKQLFGLSDNPASDGRSSHVFDYFVGLFFQNFHPLWPLFWKHDLVYDDLQPQLYLTLACIGSMYAGKRASNFHMRLLDELRKQLLLAAFDDQVSDQPLCQALVLIQAATLYFGHKKAFTLTQRLGSVVVALARKMSLFAENPAILPELLSRKTAKEPFDDVMVRWIWREERKRLAFGIFRLEVFVSILFGTRPLVSFEEVKLRLPCSDTLWNRCENRDHLAQELIFQLDRQPAYEFADLVYITLEEDAELPVLSLQDLHMLEFGLQSEVWRFSHDRGMISRLGLNDKLDGPVRPEVPSVLGPMEHLQSRNLTADLLDHSRKRLKVLRRDYARIFATLEKWHRAMVAATTPNQVRMERDTLLASYLLHHLSFIRLRADLSSLHLGFIDLMNQESSPASIRAVRQWSTSSDAADATEHALQVLALISAELERPPKERATPNMLAYIALLHAAAVIWAYSGMHASATQLAMPVDKVGGSQPGEDSVSLCRANNKVLMACLADLFKRLSPEWAMMSSFRATVLGMAEHPIPLSPD